MRKVYKSVQIYMNQIRFTLVRSPGKTIWQHLLLKRNYFHSAQSLKNSTLAQKKLQVQHIMHMGLSDVCSLQIMHIST